MTELAFPLYELDDHQDFKRRGHSFWRRGKLRSGGRIALHEVQDTPSAAVMLRRIRDHVNTDHSILTEPVEEAGNLPPQDTLRPIGATALYLSESNLENH